MPVLRTLAALAVATAVILSSLSQVTATPERPRPTAAGAETKR